MASNCLSWPATPRAAWPELPIVGIEPAIKPAAALTMTGHIGIMATHATVKSQRFQRLVQEWSGDRQMHIQACNGLALAIENALDNQANPDGETVDSLCRRYVQALGPFVQDDAQNGIDTLVLGCTHYPFAADVLRPLVGPGVRLIEPGEPVARQTARLLEQAHLLRQATLEHSPLHHGRLELLCTAAPRRLELAASQWLHLPHPQAQLLQAYTAH